MTQPQIMEEVKEHIRLLAVGHYVMAGITGLFSLLPLLHVAIGLVFLFGDLKTVSSDEAFPHQLFGAIFAGFGALIVVIGLALALAIAIAGKKMKDFHSRTYCLVIGGILCTIFPLGTVLGVLSLVTLLKPEAKTLFSS